MDVLQIGSGMVTQDNMEEYLAAENQFSAAKERSRLIAERITDMLLNGAATETGIHDAKLSFVRGRRGRRLTVKLKVK